MVHILQKEVEIFPYGEIEKRESPDFTIRSPDRTVGMGVTRAINPNCAELCILHTTDAQIHPSIPQDHDARKRQAGALVLFVRRIHESYFGPNDCRAFTQEDLSDKILFQ